VQVRQSITDRRRVFSIAAEQVVRHAIQQIPAETTDDAEQNAKLRRQAISRWVHDKLFNTAGGAVYYHVDPKTQVIFSRAWADEC
jgi:hypothetical protein